VKPKTHPARQPREVAACQRRAGALARTATHLLHATLALLLLLLPARAQIHEGVELVRATLLADTTAIVPGQPFHAGVLLEMAPGWHTYWQYSGDSGLPTRIDWKLPPGFEAGPIEWPAPEAKLEPGDIQTYGYSGSVLLAARITPPATLPPNTTLRAKTSWLVCEAICIPGSAETTLEIPTAPTAQPANTTLFEKFRSQVPSNSPPPFPIKWTRSGGTATIQADAPAPLALFPLPEKNQTAGHPQFTPPSTFRIEAPAPLRAVIASGEGPARRAWTISENATTATPAAPAAPTMTLWLALLYGLLGGAILNLMPCVLPVISLKIFGFIKQAGESRRAILAHGLAFAAGIFAWFLGLATVVIALKSAGTEATWAFQFQNPWFNIAIGSIVFAFALNLAGVFEFTLPGRAATALESTGDSSGLAGPFFQGVFATLLATPCTAPFLGTALGFAFGQNAATILAMFASVALGMALPYLLLAAQPAWMRLLPRPGPWMERLKQAMAFPLLATLVWILSILGGQRGTAGIVWFSAFLLCIALAAWLYGSFCGPSAKPRTRALALALAALTLLGGGWYFLGKKFHAPAANPAESIAWVDFSEARLQSELAAGRNVFVDFTADWCITCKFNERTAIDTPAIRALLAEKRVVPIKADWTNANPEITAALKRFGRVGVPFYLLYPAGRPDSPVILPELLTESTLADALKNLP
jgi:thiol:disulfide interchange protein DsbD